MNQPASDALARPVAHTGKLAEVIADREFAQLRIARIFHRHIARTKHVVKATDA